jgi:antitoxin ParD1/3/4
MTQVNVSLPDGLKRWIDGRIADGRYADAGDYLRDLVRRDEEQAGQLEWLQGEIDKGLSSGVDRRAPYAIFSDIREKYAAERG